MARTEQPQMGLDENVLEDADLEGLLRQEGEDKATLKAAKKEVREGPEKAKNEAAAAVDSHLDGLNLEDETTYRCGMFAITPTTRAAKDVEFTRNTKRVYKREVIATE